MEQLNNEAVEPVDSIGGKIERIKAVLDEGLVKKKYDRVYLQAVLIKHRQYVLDISHATKILEKVEAGK